MVVIWLISTFVGEEEEEVWLQWITTRRTFWVAIGRTSWDEEQDDLEALAFWD